MSSETHILAGAGAGASGLTLSLERISAAASLRDQAYTKLRQMIDEADIYHSREEIRLDEKELSEALGVSRTPVREAIVLLQREGFLRAGARRGVVILRKSRREIVEMIHMWAALESAAARLAVQRATDDDIAQLRRTFDGFRDSSAIENLGEYAEANIAFHSAIVRLSQSQVIFDTIKNIFAHVRAIRKLTLAQSDRAPRSIADHMRIIEALETRDSERAEQLVKEHSLDLAAFVEAHCDFLD